MSIYLDSSKKIVLDQSPEFYRQLHALVFTTTFVVISLNSLFLYLVIRNKVYMHYFLLVFGLTLHTSLPLFSEFDQWFFEKISVVTAMVTVCGSLLFTRSFIGLDGLLYKKWSKIFDGLIFSSLLSITLQIGNILVFKSDPFNDAISIFAAFLALITVILSIVISLALWRHKQTARLYFLINIPMLLASGIYTAVWFLQSGGQIESVDFIRFYISGGMALQMVLFSVFIGLRIKNFQKERLIFERDVNQRLQTEVTIQTKSLQEAIDEISSQKEELTKTNELKNKLFSLVAHDLRVPLNNLSAFVQLLDIDDFDKAKRDFILNDTKASLVDCILVIDRLLQWSYSQLEGINVKKETLKIEDVVNDIKQELKSLIDNKRIGFSYALEVQDILFDQSMLRVIIRNLISNAIKFSNEDSTISISSTEQVNSINISIKDEGIGMDPSWFENLIEKGKPDVKEGTKGEKGKGFGLLISKDFAEMNGGKLICESEEGAGTTFTIDIPPNKE
ncbi:MAG: ATP-binding protein [Ekhidna sp.]